MAELFDAGVLEALARPHLPRGSDRPRFTPIRSGKHNTSYWVDTDGGRYVLRLAPPDDAGLLFYERLMMRQEPELHELIRARTPVPVAEVVAFDFSRALVDRDYLLMTALPGVPLGEVRGLGRARLGGVLRQVGGYLRDLHALTAPECLGVSAYGYLGAHRPMEPQATWADAFHIMWNKLLDDVVASGCYTEGEAQGFRDLLDRQRAHFERLTMPRLLHMDVWAQNILVDGAGDVGGLVDFDRALWGDPEIEYAVLDYCGVSEPPFWEGYGARRDESEAARVRRRFYLLYELQKYMPIAVWRGKDPAGARAYKRQCLALAAPLGLRN